MQHCFTFVTSIGNEPPAELFLETTFAQQSCLRQILPFAFVHRFQIPFLIHLYLVEIVKENSELCAN